MDQDKLNSIIDVPALTDEQIKTLALLKELKTQFIDTASGAIKLNEALFGADSQRSFASASKAVSDSLNAINDTQKKVADTETKAATQREKQLNAYLVGLSKQQAAEDAAAAKRMAQIDKETAALESAAAKRKQVLAQDPTTYQGGSGDRDLSDSELQVLQAKTQALANERAALIALASAKQQNIAATQQQKAVEIDEDVILKTAISDNIRLKAELAAVATQIKANGGADQQLIIQQKALQIEIAKNAQTIGQIVKQETAAAGSADQLNARLAQLRAAYNALSKEERDNVDIGGKLITEIKQLDAETKEIAESQGVYNKSVGDYENAIKNAISQYVPYGSQLVQGINSLKTLTDTQGEATSSLGKLALGFAGFSVAAAAAGIALVVNYLNQFQDTTDKIDVALGDFKARIGSLGQSISESLTPKENKGSVFKFIVDYINDEFNSINPLYKATKALNTEFEKSTDAVGKAGAAAVIAGKKYEDLNTTLSLQSKLLQGQAQDLRALARDKIAGTQAQIDLLDKADAKERQVIVNQTKLGEESVKLAIQVGNIYSKLTASQIDALNKGDIALAASLNRSGAITKTGYELYKEALNQRADALNASVTLEDRIKSQRDNLALKQDKATATDLIKQQKEQAKEELSRLEDSYSLKIQKAKDNAAALRIVQSDNNNPEGVRYAALQGLLDKEDKIADLEAAKAKLKSNNLNGIETARLAQRALNRKQYDVEYEKIISDDAKKQKDIEDKRFKDSLEAYKAYSDDQLDGFAQDYAKQEFILSQQYASGLLTEDQYQKAKLDIIKKYNNLVDQENLKALALRITQEAYAGKSINSDLEAYNKLKAKIDKDGNSEQVTDNEKKGQAIIAANKQEKEQVIADEKKGAQDIEAVIKSLVDSRFEAAKQNIETQKTAVDTDTKNQIDAENRSLDSAKVKADKINLINAQAAVKKELLDKQAKKIAYDQAKFERELAIAKIVEETAVNVVKSGLNPLLIAAAIALGALETAAVLSSPLPAYAKGGKHGGGLMIAGEMGTELMIDPSGRLGLTPDVATVMDAKAGTRIVDHASTMKILANPQRVQYVGGQQIDLSRLEGISSDMLRELRNKPKRQGGTTHNYDNWNRIVSGYVN